MGYDAYAVWPLTWVIKASELGNDWRPEAHARVEGLLLFQWRRIQEIKKIREEYQRRIAKLDDEERTLTAQRKVEAKNYG